MQLPETNYRLEQLRGDTSDTEFQRQLQGALNGGVWAFRGPGNESRVDIWLFLKLIDSQVLVIQCQVKSHQYRVKEQRKLVMTEALKQFAIGGRHTNLFVYFTDAELPEMTQNSYSLLIDRDKRPEFFTPQGALKREYIEQLASERFKRPRR
jgi:hypothetical protein